MAPEGDHQPRGRRQVEDLLDGQASATASLFQLERTNIKSVNPITNTLVPLGVQRRAWS